MKTVLHLLQHPRIRVSLVCVQTRLLLFKLQVRFGCCSLCKLVSLVKELAAEKGKAVLYCALTGAEASYPLSQSLCPMEALGPLNAGASTSDGVGGGNSAKKRRSATKCTTPLILAGFHYCNAPSCIVKEQRRRRDYQRQPNSSWKAKQKGIRET